MATDDPQIITDDQGQPVLTPSTPVNPKIVLPVTKSVFISGFKKSIQEAGRWLSVLLRLIKKKTVKLPSNPMLSPNSFPNFASLFLFLGLLPAVAALLYFLFTAFVLWFRWRDREKIFRIGHSFSRCPSR